MNRSQISNDFNFDNQLDITQNKRDRTEQYFSKDGFAFEDFMNIGGDPTNKSIDKMSSKYNNNTSEIFRKEQDSGLNPIIPNTNIIDYLTEHSIRAKRKDTSVLNSLLTHSDPPELAIAPSPKFAEELIRGTAKSIQDYPKREFTLRRTETVGADKQEVMQGSRFERQKSMKASEAFKKKPTPGERMKEEEYKQLENQIHFYEDAIARMVYESQRMQEETETLLGSFNSAAHEAEINAAARDIKAINAKIQEQRNLQVQLGKMVSHLQDEYEQLIISIKSSQFPRPVRVKDETKAILDQINALRAQFEALQRDQGSLNLSSTLVPHANSSLQPGNTFRPIKEESPVGLTRIQEIYEQNKRSEDPRFLQNIKMACLRDQWSLYSNGELQVHLSYRHCPRVRITIGNKLPRDLQKFSLSQDGVSRLQGETVAARSYILHQIQMNEETIEKMFIKCELSYQLQDNRRVVTLFIPTGITTFGEFSPVTAKEFAADAGTEDFQYSLGFRPIDKKLVADVTEVQHYMPNLLVDRENYKCNGMFISLFNAFTFVQLKQKGELLSVGAKTPDWALVRLLHFIFTL